MMKAVRQGGTDYGKETFCRRLRIFNTYDFIINDDDEVMLLIYVQNNTPSDPHLDIDIENKQAILYRSENNGLTIEDIPDDILDLLYDLDKMLVCELSAEENEDDTEIANVYEATINII